MPFSLSKFSKFLRVILFEKSDSQFWASFPFWCGNFLLNAIKVSCSIWKKYVVQITFNKTLWKRDQCTLPLKFHSKPLDVTRNIFVVHSRLIICNLIKLLTHLIKKMLKNAAWINPRKTKIRLIVNFYSFKQNVI